MDSRMNSRPRFLYICTPQKVAAIGMAAVSSNLSFIHCQMANLTEDIASLHLQPLFAVYQYKRQVFTDYVTTDQISRSVIISFCAT